MLLHMGRKGVLDDIQKQPVLGRGGHGVADEVIVMFYAKIVGLPHSVYLTSSLRCDPYDAVVSGLSKALCGHLESWRGVGR